MQRLENIVKKHDEVKMYVEKSNEEVEYGDSASAAVLVSLFVAASSLCFLLKGVVGIGSSKPITMEVSAGC
jgi:hypothetical protein